MAVSKRLRYEVLRRDNHQCKYCGAGAPDAALTVDHVVPTALGGSDGPSNLVAACKDCNAGKAASSPDAALVAEVSQQAAEWGRAMTVTMDQRMAEFSARNARVKAFDQAWQSWSDMPREAAWRDSIRRFLAFGLTDEFLAAAVDTAMGNRSVRHGDVWKYFCGICWTEIKSAQAAAAPVLSPTSTAPRTSQSLTEPFDYMALFDDFTELVVSALGGDEEVMKFTTYQLWAAMSAGHAAWLERLEDVDWPLNEDQDSIEEAANAAARDRMSEYLNEPFAEIVAWRKARYETNGS